MYLIITVLKIGSKIDLLKKFVQNWDHYIEVRLISSIGDTPPRRLANVYVCLSNPHAR
jgi:hypothetical protein